MEVKMSLFTHKTVIVVILIICFHCPQGSAEDQDDLILKIELVNWITRDQAAKGYQLEYFNGSPLFISVSIINEAAWKYLAQVNSEHLSQAEREIKLKEFKPPQIGTEEFNWKSFLKMYLIKRGDKEINILDKIKAIDLEYPIYKNERSKSYVKDRRLKTSFAIPGKVTKQLEPGNYELYFIYDNSNFAREKGELTRYLLKSNSINLELRATETRCDEAQVLFYLGEFYLKFDDIGEYLTLNNRAIEICPEFPTPYIVIASQAMEQKNYTLAQEILVNCLNILKTTNLKHWVENDQARNYEISLVERDLKFINRIIESQ